MIFFHFHLNNFVSVLGMENPNCVPALWDSPEKETRMILFNHCLGCSSSSCLARLFSQPITLGTCDHIWSLLSKYSLAKDKECHMRWGCILFRNGRTLLLTGISPGREFTWWRDSQPSEAVFADSIFENINVLMAEFWKALFILSLIHATKLTKRWKTYDRENYMRLVMMVSWAVL